MKFDKGTVVFEEDPLTEAIRQKVRIVIERIINEELKLRPCPKAQSVGWLDG